jgi:hypothetical protein
MCGIQVEAYRTNPHLRPQFQFYHAHAHAHAPGTQQTEHEAEASADSTGIQHGRT